MKRISILLFNLMCIYSLIEAWSYGISTVCQLYMLQTLHLMLDMWITFQSHLKDSAHQPYYHGLTPYDLACRPCNFAGFTGNVGKILFKRSVWILIFVADLCTQYHVFKTMKDQLMSLVCVYLTLLNVHCLSVHSELFLPLSTVGVREVPQEDCSEGCGLTHDH